MTLHLWVRPIKTKSIKKNLIVGFKSNHIVSWVNGGNNYENWKRNRRKFGKPMANYVQGIVGIDVVALLGDIIMNYKKHLSTLQIVVMMFFFFFFYYYYYYYLSV